MLQPNWQELLVLKKPAEQFLQKRVLLARRAGCWQLEMGVVGVQVAVGVR
jgi:hypothetical protein